MYPWALVLSIIFILSLNYLYSINDTDVAVVSVIVHLIKK